MDSMHDRDDTSPNAKVILLAVGGAALAALALAASRRRDRDESELRARADAVAEEAKAAVGDAKKDAKKAAKAAKKKQKALSEAAAAAGERLADKTEEKVAALGSDARDAERDLKAAAWDALQKAREAETKLRAAGHRVVDDTAHLASIVGAEARSLAGEGKERLTHLRHRDDDENAAGRELERLRAELEELKTQLGRAGRKAGRDYEGLASELAAKLPGKGGRFSEAMASQAAAAALTHVERSLREKAPALLAAKNRAQIMEILQKELGSTLREAATEAATAALGLWESGRERADAVRDQAREVEDQARDRDREIEDQAEAAVRDVADDAAHRLEAARANGKRRFWRSAHDVQDVAHSVGQAVEASAERADDDGGEQGRRGKAGLFWGGAGIGLALYALLDAERREQVLRLANEASIQIQELVRDLQGYDDEF
jgi:hypothetical protein